MILTYLLVWEIHYRSFISNGIQYVDLTMYWYMDLYVVENDIVYNISVGVRAGLCLKWHYDDEM